MTRIAINDFINPRQLKADLAFTEAEVNTALIEQPAKFAYYASLYYQADKQYGKIKQILEITEASVDKAVRLRYEGAGKPPTEANIRGMVVRDPTVIAATKAYYEAKSVLQLLKSAVEAFRHRRDMLIQVSLNRREELKGEIRIMKGGPDRIDQRLAGAAALTADLAGKAA